MKASDFSTPTQWSTARFSADGRRRNTLDAGAKNEPALDVLGDRRRRRPGAADEQAHQLGSGVVVAGWTGTSTSPLTAAASCAVEGEDDGYGGAGNDYDRAAGSGPRPAGGWSTSGDRTRHENDGLNSLRPMARRRVTSRWERQPVRSRVMPNACTASGFKGPNALLFVESYFEGTVVRVIGRVSPKYAPQSTLSSSLRLPLAPDGKSVTYSVASRSANLSAHGRAKHGCTSLRDAESTLWDSGRG